MVGGLAGFGFTAVGPSAPASRAVPGNRHSRLVLKVQYLNQPLRVNPSRTIGGMFEWDFGCITRASFPNFTKEKKVGLQGLPKESCSSLE